MQLRFLPLRRCLHHSPPIRPPTSPLLYPAAARRPPLPPITFSTPAGLPPVDWGSAPAMGSSFAQGSRSALQGRGGSRSGPCFDPARQLWHGGGPLVRGGGWRRSCIRQQPRQNYLSSPLFFSTQLNFSCLVVTVCAILLNILYHLYVYTSR